MKSRVQRFPLRAALLGALLVFMNAGLGAAELSGDDAWMRFEEGKRLYEARSFDQALVAFRSAIALKREKYTKAFETYQDLLQEPIVKGTANSIRKLLDRMAREELRQGDVARIKAATKGDLYKEINAYKEYRLSNAFSNYVFVLEMALNLKPEQSLKNSILAVGAALKAGQEYPEAEFWVGKVFLAEGEAAIAESQFKRALEEVDSFKVYEFMYRVKYELADLYKIQKNYMEYEKLLTGIVAQDRDFSSKEQAFLRTSMERMLRERGIDRFLELYRTSGDFALQAFSLLGEYYYKCGRYSQAVQYLMFAVDGQCTKLIGELKRENPDYSFSGTKQLLANLKERPDLKQYADENELRKNLYYLGMALYGDGSSASSFGILRAISGGSDEWASRAKGKLARPGLDTVEANPDI
jgi:hypothetical protein